MNDEELRQAMAVLDSYREQLEALTRQAQLLQMTFEETNRARETLKAFNAAKEGDEILMPIGASSFVTAKVTGNKTALVGIGNKLAAEKTLDESISKMDAAIEELSDALRKSGSTLSELELATSNLTVAIQNEYKRRQQ
jgi:prefoldin alpha subunit